MNREQEQIKQTNEKSKTQHLFSQGMHSFNKYSLSSFRISGTERYTNKNSYFYESYILMKRDIKNTK